MTQFEDRQWPACDRYRVLGRVGSARWQYMGLYKVTKLSAWTPAEVKNFRVAVRPFLHYCQLGVTKAERLSGLGQVLLGNDNQGVKMGTPCAR